MTSNEKDADSYRGDLADDRNLRPLMIALIAIVVVWTLAYLVGGATDRPSADAGARLESSSSAVRWLAPDPDARSVAAARRRGSRQGRRRAG